MPTQTDINNLMQKMVSAVQTTREHQKETQTRTRVKQSPTDDTWVSINTALVQLTNNYRCRGCGKTFSAPNPWLFVKREEGKQGLHYIKIDEHIAFDQSLWDLPYITEQRHIDVPTCELCFDMTRIFNGHYKQPEQICLPLELH